jgi:signal transduction histidine kinase
MNKILFYIFLFGGTVLTGQDSCDTYEDKMMAYFDAHSNLEEALRMFDEYSSKDCADMLLAYNFIGFSYYNESDFQKAKEYYIQGEDVYSENSSNVEQFVINQMYTGLILIAERDFESAEYHLNKANKLVGRVNNNFVKGTIYQNIGLLNVETGNLDAAEKYFEMAANTGSLDTISIGYIYQNLAFLNLKRGNKEKTKEFIHKTKELWSTLEYAKGKYLLSFIEAKNAIKEKDFSEALDLLIQGRTENVNSDKLLLGENYLIEAQIHEGLQNKDAQLLALEKAVLESDDLSEIQLKETIYKLSEIQNLEKTNIVLSELVSKLKNQNLEQKKIDLRRNSIMDIESDKDESIIKTQLKYLILSGSIILLLCYLFFRIWKQNKDIQILNKDLNSSKLKIENQVEKLQQKNKDLEQFAYVASHDLKSPLRTISSFAQLLKKKGFPDEKGYLDRISNSAQSMSTMISDLLNYSLLDQKLNIEQLNLKELIAKTVDSLSAQITESNCKINIDKSCNQFIPCDKILFSSVIQNLISNSIRYCKLDVYPEIDISLKKLGDHLEIYFVDNGIGIDDQYQEKIFEMFARLKTKDINGTGIGLATCKKIIEKHQGTITVKSTLGVGSTFIVTLPIKKVYSKRNRRRIYPKSISIAE